MNFSQHIQKRLQQQIDLLSMAADTLEAPLSQAAETIVRRLLEGGKLLSCGNGSCALLAQQLNLAMAHRFERQRPGLPAMALPADAAMITAIAGDSDFDEIYAGQVHALGHPGDLLFAISKDGNCDSIAAAIAAAHEREIQVILLAGDLGGSLKELLAENDLAICIPEQSSSQVLELQLWCINCICELIDLQLLGN